MSDTIRQTMRDDLESLDAFERAKEHAYRYAQTIDARAVAPTEEALAALALFDEPMPEHMGSAVDIVDQLNTLGGPATVAQTGGRYFGFVNGGVVPAALAVRWLSDIWDQNSALYVMSPVTAKLESVCESWLTELLGLPSTVVAGFVSGTSMSICCGLAAGRYRLLHNAGWDVNQQGLNGAPPLRVITGEQCHATVKKAATFLGLGLNCIEYVPCDDQGRIREDALPPLDEHCLVVLQAGNVNSGAFDAFEPVCRAAKASGAWVHVDGAFGLWAAASSSLSYLTRGMSLADSWSVDAHKTLNTPYDSGITLCADRDALVGSLQTTGSYILYSEQRDSMLYTPEMSKRARGIELWATLKYLGRQGVDDLITGLHQRAVQMADLLVQAGFNVLNEVVFNQVVVVGNNTQETQQLIEQVQQSGVCWVGGSVWQGQNVIRISVCSWKTTEADILRSVEAFVAARKAINSI